ncbi:MAG: VTT domain-containing protein [Proteobacteria bacterium]|nr:VTT domain-containing protein [Pseudomonadota bacterium]
MKFRIVVRGILLFVTAILIGIALKATPLGDVLDKSWIDSAVRGHGHRGELLFLLMGAAMTAVGLPRQAVSFLAGYAFDLWTGTALAVLATMLGCITTFSYARFLGRDLLKGKFPERIRRFDAFLKDNPFTTTLLIRFLPAGSNFLTNLVAGVSSVPAVPFVLGSGAGYIPQTLIFALVGSGFAVEANVKLGISVVLFAASAMLGLSLYRRYRDTHHLLNAGVVDADDVGTSEAGRS